MPTIKEYAKEAKARLKSGFWEEVIAKRAQDVKTAVNQGKNSDVVFCEYREVLKRKLFDGDSEEDEIFYKKVCELLSGDKVVINPIGELADKQKMQEMNESSRQQYIFELSKKFKKMKDRFYSEREINCHG